MVLIPAWFLNMHRVYNGALFILDFCWVANAFFATYMAFLWFDGVPTEWRRFFFVTFYSVALGPLAWACILLHNGLIFHSVAKITSLFIHMMPSLVAWSIVTWPDEVCARWPGRFMERAELEEVTLANVYQFGFLVYFIWWVLHSAWLLSIGTRCPEKGWNTVFEDLYQKQNLGAMFKSCTGLESVRSHAALYLIIHLLLDMLAFVSPVLCFRFRNLHAAFCVLLFLSAAWSGAGYYEYVMTGKYNKVVQKLLTQKDDARALRKALGESSC